MLSAPEPGAGERYIMSSSTILSVCILSLCIVCSHLRYISIQHGSDVIIEGLTIEAIIYNYFFAGVDHGALGVDPGLKYQVMGGGRCYPMVSREVRATMPSLNPPVPSSDQGWTTQSFNTCLSFSLSLHCRRYLV